MNVAAETNFVDKHADEGLGDQTPFMMTSFAPWGWEVDVHASQRAVRNHVADDFDRVVANDAHIRERLFGQAFGECPDAGGKDFAAQKIHFRMCGRNGCCGFAHAAADFEHNRRFATEDGGKVKRGGRVLNGVLRELFFKSALLRIGDMAAAQYKTANMAVLELFEFFWREFFLFHGESGQSSVPESARF